MANSQQPPKNGNDLIVMTRLNTVGLKRLAEGTLVEKKPFESKPPEPMRRSEPPKAVLADLAEPPIVPPPSKAAPIPTLLEDDELGADGSEDRTIGLGADGSEDRTLAAPVRTPPPSPALPPPSSAPARAELKNPGPASMPRDARLEIETPTALFVKDIQRTLKEELDKYEPMRPASPLPKASSPSAPPLSLGFADMLGEPKAGQTAPAPAPAPSKPPARLEKAASMPAPPAARPASLAAPAKSTSSLPAPLPAQASRRKDPIAVSVTTRPLPRVERRGGFVPWAAALTALGVFVGVAGARIATGAPFLRSAPPATAPAAAAPAPTTAAVETGFAPHVAMPAQPATDEAKPAEPPAPAAPPAPVATVEEAKPEAKPAEKPVEAVVAQADSAKAKAAPEKVEKPEAKADAPKPEPRVERPRHRSAPPPAAAPAPEREEKVAKAEKPEPAPKPAKPEPAAKPEGKKSPDVAAAARDYAAVESQLGSSL